MHSLTGLLQLLSRSTTTIYRWVQRFTPLLADAARPCRHAVGTRWWVDETYVKVRGQWRYVYQAIDQFGQVIDVFVSPRRDTTAARRFFQHALATTQVTPTQVITDKAATYTYAWISSPTQPLPQPQAAIRLCRSGAQSEPAQLLVQPAMTDVHFGAQPPHRPAPSGIPI